MNSPGEKMGNLSSQGVWTRLLLLHIVNLLHPLGHERFQEISFSSSSKKLTFFSVGFRESFRFRSLQKVCFLFFLLFPDLPTYALYSKVVFASSSENVPNLTCIDIETEQRSVIPETQHITSIALAKDGR